MKCQILFSGKNKKNISKCRLLKILPRVLSVKRIQHVKTLQIQIHVNTMYTLFLLLIKKKKKKYLQYNVLIKHTCMFSCRGKEDGTSKQIFCCKNWSTEN